MSEDRTRELPEASPFEKRVLAEFATLRGEVGEIRAGVVEIRSEVVDLRTAVASLRSEVTEIRTEVAEIRTQQVAMARNIAGLDQRLTSLEERVDNRLKETQPIWEAVKEKIDKLDEKFTLFIRDLYDIRGEISRNRKRLDILEIRVLS